nr:zinc ABC transporter substrate-binding protein [Pseudaestuariivita atlantica]
MITRRHALSLTLGAAALARPVVAWANAPLSVVATTGMIADTARRIGGDLVEVRALMGPGVDPHAYRQTRSDIAAMTRADLVLWNGLYLEAQLEEFMHTLSRRMRVEALAEALPTHLLRAHQDYADRYDPHVWMVPALWRLVAEELARVLRDIRPDAADRIDANLAAYIAELESVGAYAADVLGQVPPEARVLLTAHDAFGYFGDAYGYEVIGVQGISTESEAGLHRITELVDLLVERRVGAVFVETSVSDRNMRALIEGAAARGHTVRIGGELFSDAMGIDGTYEGTLIGMLDHNATVIARALGADVPAGGMSGRLGLKSARLGGNG